MTAEPAECGAAPDRATPGRRPVEPLSVEPAPAESVRAESVRAESVPVTSPPIDPPAAAPQPSAADRLTPEYLLTEELEVMEDIARDVRHATPRWVAPVFGAGAVLLLPWIVVLALTLPERDDSGHWNVAWVGFDVALLFTLACTAWLARQGRRSVELPAIATTTLLIVDAWFDITTSPAGWQLAEAIVLAVCVELPLAALSFYIARHVEVVIAAAEGRLRRERERLARAVRRSGID